MSGKRVLVTGANGHVGYSLVELLIERGYNVRASVRNKDDENLTRHLKKLDVSAEFRKIFLRKNEFIYYYQELKLSIIKFSFFYFFINFTKILNIILKSNFLFYRLLFKEKNLIKKIKKINEF